MWGVSPAQRFGSRLRVTDPDVEHPPWHVSGDPPCPTPSDGPTPDLNPYEQLAFFKDVARRLDNYLRLGPGISLWGRAEDGKRLRLS